MSVIIEHVYGDRGAGKTTDLRKQLNDKESIGVVGIDVQHNKLIMEYTRIRKFKNIVFLTKPQQVFGRHFDLVLIDDAEYINWEEWKRVLMDSTAPEGARIILYLNSPAPNFSIRLLPKRLV